MPKRGGSRGRKKPSLRNLSRELPSKDEFERFVRQDLDSMDARALALVLTAFVDHYLERVIVAHCVLLSEKQFNELFREKAAPLGTLSAKIAMAHALGIFSVDAKENLDRMRIIRNTFAHSMVGIDFDHPLVASECNLLDPGTLLAPYRETGTTPRDRFKSFGIAAPLYCLMYIAKRVASGQFVQAAEPEPPPSDDKSE